MLAREVGVRECRLDLPGGVGRRFRATDPVFDPDPDPDPDAMALRVVGVGVEWTVILQSIRLCSSNGYAK